MAEYEIKNGVGIIPEGTTEIESYAFRDCKELTNVTIPSSVTKIGWSAFQGCTGLTSIEIPDSVTEIGDDAFSGCTGLTSITIPDSVTEIGHYAFSRCTGLVSVTLGNSLKTIGYNAFYCCSGLTKIVIPASVTECVEPFVGCIALTSIEVDKNNTVYDSRENCNAIIETATNKLISGCSATTIPDSVSEIEGNAFNSCTKLTDIVIPASVKKIGNFAFAGCTGLTNIIVPKSVKTLGSRVFVNCTNLKSVSILGPVSKIDEIFFIDDPDSIRRSLPHENLETITFGTGIKKIEGLSGYQFPNLKAIYVPAQKVDYYKERLFDSFLEKIVELPPEKKAKK